jgi:hypothetical protein
MDKKKVSIVFSAGRKTVHPVAEMLTQNLIENGHQDKFDLNLIISFDPTFYGLSEEDFKIHGKAAEFFGDRIIYTGPEDYENLKNDIGELVEDQIAFDILFKPRGYCTQKNRAIVHALRKGADTILFLDDDEYFTSPFKKVDGSLEWIDQDILGRHMGSQEISDITNGAHTGYFSPVPSEIDTKLEQGLRERLGRILAIGNEVIKTNTFVNTRDAIRFGSREFVESPGYEIQEVNGVKVLSGGNVALNVNAIREGKFPPYFNPTGARGEDAILGMQLSDTKVLRVPTYTFHDPFQKYKEITQREFPKKLEAIQVIPGTVDRFAKACIGWVRYAPLLLRLTTTSDEEYKDRIRAMQAELSEIGDTLTERLNSEIFSEMGPTLENYHQRSKLDVEELARAKKGWYRLVSNL